MGAFNEYTPVTVPAPSGTWQVRVRPGASIDPNYALSANAAEAGQITWVSIDSQGSSVLTAAGWVAFLAQVNSYGTNLTPAVVATGATVTTSSKDVTGLSTTAGVVAGMPVTDYGSGVFAAGSVVAAVNSSSEVHVSINATGSTTSMTTDVIGFGVLTTTAKITSILQNCGAQAGELQITVTPSRISYPVLAADAAGQASSLTTLLKAAAGGVTTNVT